MRFICLLPVRDEADIIGQCLGHLLKWADAIYVFDTGSVDRTWEIIQDWASRDKRVVPLKKDSVYMSDSRLRGWLFHQVRSKMRNGDWFLRVDADEFYHIPPPEFVKTRLRRHETIAWYQCYDFWLTESEVKAWDAGQETRVDRQRPIEERRHWFTPRIYSEPRLCKYRETMRWPPTISFPFNSGFVARERLPFRHYPHRDPVQFARRCRLRAIMMADKENRANWTQPELHHWSEQDWRKFIVPDNMPGLRYWAPGMELPELRLTGHLAKLHRRAAQRIAHAFCLPILDRLRPAWPEETYPLKVSEEVRQCLAQELKE